VAAPGGELGAYRIDSDTLVYLLPRLGNSRPGYVHSSLACVCGDMTLVTVLCNHVCQLFLSVPKIIQISHEDF